MGHVRLVLFIFLHILGLIFKILLTFEFLSSLKYTGGGGVRLDFLTVEEGTSFPGLRTEQPTNTHFVYALIN